MKAGSARNRAVQLAWVFACVLVALGFAQCQDQAAGWQQQVRDQVAAHHLDVALVLVDERLRQDGADLEARFWRGRLLAWEGQWAAAESEYGLVLEHAPNDSDVLAALADVLRWQKRSDDALVIIDRARAIAPIQPEILLRRARILHALGRDAEAQRQYREILRIHPHNREARAFLEARAAENKHELRAGMDASTFNYTGVAESQALALTSRWSRRLSSSVETDFSQRFGETATRFVAGVALHATRDDVVNAGGALANANHIIPEHEAFFGYSHSFRISARQVKGLELSYQQHWFWYEGVHVITLGLTQLYYLPRNWTWSFSVTGARSGFAGSGVEWVPSGFSRLGFPIVSRLSGNLVFATGTENFAAIDQVGHFSAHTFGGGLKYAFGRNQDLTGYVTAPRRSGGRTQNSYGVSYGFRF